MTRDEMIEILEQIQVPGATGEWWHEGGVIMAFNTQDFWNIIEEFHRRRLFSDDHRLTNTIRFGAARFIGDAMRAWDDCLDDLPPEVQALWDACNEPGDTADLPWSLFTDAFPWLLYHAPEALWDAVLDEDRYYDVDITASYDDASVTIRIGTGWSDFWVMDFTIPDPCSLGCEDFIGRLNTWLPYYMRVLE